LVAVVTSLNTSLQMTITTGSCCTTIQARIGLNLVAIVAGFDAGLNV